MLVIAAVNAAAVITAYVAVTVTDIISVATFAVDLQSIQVFNKKPFSTAT